MGLETRILGVLGKLTKALASDRPLEKILRGMARDVAIFMKANSCAILLLDEATRELSFKESYGLTRWERDNIRFRMGEGVAGWVGQHRKAARIDDVAVDPRFKAFDGQKTPIRSMLCVPLLHQRRLIGVMAVTSPKKKAFGDGERLLLDHLAGHAALEIENYRLHDLAVTDSLTQLFNRRYFERRLEDEISRARRFREPLSVCLADLDGFKSVNDTQGHAKGDEVLVRVAETFRNRLRVYDVVARYGGDEFAILFSNTPRPTAEMICGRLREGIEGAIRPVTASLGLSVFPDDGDRSEALLESADQALYRAKGAGGNRVV